MPGPVYNSIVEIPGDGVTTQHEFSFAGGYISRTHVKARITDAVGAITEITVTDGMFVGAFTLNIGVVTPVGSTLRIYRKTPRDVPLVDFAGGSRITEANLDLLTQQAIFGVAEAFDAGEYANVNDLLAAAGVSAATAVSAAAAAAASATTATNAADEAVATLASKMDKSANLSDVANVATARTNLGLGSAAVRAALGTAGSLYSRDSILGAVSQSAGVPTGAIIENITGGAGRAIRFADGTQICTHSLASGTTSTAQGAVYKSGGVGGTWAAAFTAAPVCVVSVSASANAVCWPGQVGPLAATFTGADAFAPVNTASCTINIVAIGRWY